MYICICVFTPFATVTAHHSGERHSKKTGFCAARSGQTLYPNTTRWWLGQNLDLTAATFVAQQLWSCQRLRRCRCCLGLWKVGTVFVIGLVSHSWIGCGKKAFPANSRTQLQEQQTVHAESKQQADKQSSWVAWQSGGRTMACALA